MKQGRAGMQAELSLEDVGIARDNRANVVGPKTRRLEALGGLGQGCSRGAGKLGTGFVSMEGIGVDLSCRSCVKSCRGGDLFHI
jgi:hypothetical protein